MRTSLYSPRGWVLCRRAGSQHGSDAGLVVWETNRQNNSVLFTVTLHLIKIAKMSGGVMMWFFSLLCCGKGRWPFVLLMLIQTGGRRGFFFQILWWAKFLFTVLSLFPSLARSLWRQHVDESDESLLVSVAHMGPGCQGNCQQGPWPPTSRGRRFKPHPASSRVHTRPSLKMRIRAMKSQTRWSMIYPLRATFCSGRPTVKLLSAQVNLFIKRTWQAKKKDMSDRGKTYKKMCWKGVHRHNRIW